MIRLWFWPFKLQLDQHDKWQSGVQGYRFDLQLVLASDQIDANSAPQGAEYSQTYKQPIDQLQEGLGCCGLWHAEEWRDKTRFGFIPPSCCPNPISLDFTSLVRTPSLEDSSWPVLRQRMRFDNRKYLWSQNKMYYCLRVPIERSVGCQQILDENESRFIFGVRVSLLLLLGVQFINLLSAQILLSLSKQSTDLVTSAVVRHQPHDTAGPEGDLTLAHWKSPPLSVPGPESNRLINMMRESAAESVVTIRE